MTLCNWRSLVWSGLIAVNSAAIADDYTVTNVKCVGGWVKQGDDKFAVLAKCGEPVMVDVISGDDGPKLEKLAFQLKNEKQITVFTFKGGKLQLIEKISN